MTDAVRITRIAARGEGVSEDGRHVALSAPGDVLHEDGTLERGPRYQEPPCRHFPRCGGCQLQHLDETAWAGFVRERVVNGAHGQGLTPEHIAAPVLSPPASRRRATLHAAARGREVLIGFREQGTHRIIDMRECHVLAPQLFALVGPLRALLRAFADRRMTVDISLTLADQGVDCGIGGLHAEGLNATERLIAFAQDHALARLTIDRGFGAEAMWEPDPVTVTLSGVPVALPPGGFLQPTREGETALVAAAREYIGNAETVADLFSGLGTFAFALAGKARVYAAEAARDAHLACKAAAGRAQAPVFADHRDLFRNPLLSAELDRFDAVLLDPPRAGAREQVVQLAESRVPRICYISCNPASWARDAARLVAGGYRLADLRPIGQFRWSTHVELASLFVR